MTPLSLCRDWLILNISQLLVPSRKTHAVVVSQLAEHLPTILEVHGSNPVIGKILL